jgi:hypothetical protein
MSGLQFLIAPCALIVDHVLEVQMVEHHLKEHNIDLTSVFSLILLRYPLIIFLFSKMHPGLQTKVKNIVNHPDNLALIPGHINQSV